MQAQLNAFKGEKFNSISLFFSEGISRNVYISSQGSNGASYENSLNISEALSIGAGKNLSAQQYGSVAISISDSSVSIGSITTALNNVCYEHRQGQHPPGSNSLLITYLRVVNLEANSRIMDVDVAEETTNMAKYNLQVYAASAALAQSNLNMGIVLDLLNFNSSRR